MQAFLEDGFNIQYLAMLRKHFFSFSALCVLNRINKNKTLSLVLYKYVYKFLITSLMHMKGNQTEFIFLSYIKRGKQIYHGT